MQSPREDITKVARGRWIGILAALGVPDRHLTNKHGPCPLCGGKDRFRFDDKDARGTWICAQCGAGDGFALVMRLKDVDFKGAALLVKQAVGRVPATIHAPYIERHEDRDKLSKIWSSAEALTENDPVMRYLRSRNVAPEVAITDVRYGPQPYWHDGKKIGQFDAMVALVRDKDGNAVSIHCTYLLDGNKAPVVAPKKLLLPVGVGSAIRLFAAGDTLALTEGIETALAVYGRGGVPTWATITAGGMKNFVCPQSVSKVEVWADQDENYTGQEAAYALAKRLRMEGKYVSVYLPQKMGADWADYHDYR